MLKTSKKILSTIMVVIMVLTAVPLSSFVGLELPALDWGIKASALAESGTCGSNVTYTYNSITKELVISGKGMMLSYSSGSYSPFYQSDIKSVIIQDGVSSIGSRVFYDCVNLESVIIPKTVANIGADAFYNCLNLEKVIVPDTVTSLDSGGGVFHSSTMLLVNKNSVAFAWVKKNNRPFALLDPESPEDNIILENVNNKLSYSIDKLSRTLYVNNQGNMINFAPFDALWKQYSQYIIHVVIVDGCESISDNAFENMDYLKDVSLPNTIKTIGDRAFAGCEALEIIEIGDNVVTIGESVFNGCLSLKNVVIGNGLTSINNYTFKDCSSLIEVVIGDSVERIYTGAFEGCSSLETVILPRSINQIDFEAFSGTGLREIHIPSFSCSIDENSIYYRATICGLNNSSVKAFADKYGYNFIILNVECDEHTFTQWSYLTIANCTENGLSVRNCEVCGVVEERVVPAEGHIYKSEVITPATHLEEGEELFTCICGDNYTIALAKKEEHSYKCTLIPSNCLYEGIETYICECGDTYSEAIPATGHTYSEWVELLPATCSERGLNIKICKDCNDIQRQIIPKLAHIDADGNGVCDTCENTNTPDAPDTPAEPDTPDVPDTPNEPDVPEDPSANCSCNCHKSGLSKIIFNLILFFQKLLRSNKTCFCGVDHY